MYRRIKKAFFWIIALCATGVIASAPAQTAAQANPADHAFEYWYLDTLDDQPCGYTRHRLANHDGILVTTYHEYSVQAHGGQVLTYRLNTEWKETLGFQPISYRFEEHDGAEPVVKTYRFQENHIELTSEQGGRAVTTTLKHPEGDWLSPAAFSLAVERAMARQDPVIVLRTWDPQLGDQPYTVRYADPTEIDRDLPGGHTKPVTRWRVTYSYLPGLSVYEYFDNAYRPAGYTLDIGGGQTISSYPDDAKVTRMVFDPPEVARRSVVIPDRPIEDVAAVRRAVYELSFGGDGRVEVLPPTLPHQRVERLGDRGVRITVDLDAAGGGEKDDLPTHEHLAASIMVDHTDLMIQTLTRHITRQTGIDPAVDPAGYAMECQRFVARHLSGYSLAVGNATAGEAARSQEGDCTECTVLLAALLRAGGIPSRGVSGLVYSTDAFVGVEHAFVYHMWTQAWIANDPDNPQASGRWVDLDSAMRGYSAGHIALGVTALGENADAEELRLVPMTLDLSIAVKQTAR